MELFKLFGTIAINNHEANNGIDETTGKAKDSQSKIVEAFKKIGTTVVTYFAVDKIIEFGGACIDAASDAQAMESQFTQVFGELESQAAQNLSGIADAAGIAENRMKGSYTKIAAFAKTSGMETADALSLADRAMMAVADSAAFYDRSLEETTESLQSFLKGNFENDAALGLSATETTRNAAANELYGKSFKDLSESQKQLTLLKMVEDANALSGAMGQAARESETWTNQVGNLKQVWTDFKSAIGGYFLEEAVGGITKAADAVKWLQDKVTDLLEMWGEVIAPAVNDVGAAFGNVWTALEPIGQAFLNLLPKTKAMSNGLSFIGQVAWWLEEILLAVADRLNTVGAWITEHTPHLIEIINTLWTTLQFLWQTVGQPVFDMIQNMVGTVRNLFAQYMPEIKEFVSQCFTDIQNFWNNNLKPCFEAIGNFIQTVLAPVVEAVFNERIKGTIERVFQAIKSLWNDVLKPVFTGITDFLTGVFTLNFEQAWEGIKKIFSGIVNWFINGIEFMVNGSINALNGLIEGLNKLVSIAGKALGLELNIPTIPLRNLPRLEKGGILGKGQVGLLEGRGAEAVVPLDQNRAWISAVARDMQGAMGGKETVGILQEIREGIYETNDNIGRLEDSILKMKMVINQREFARAVKGVN